MRASDTLPIAGSGARTVIASARVTGSPRSGGGQTVTSRGPYGASSSTSSVSTATPGPATATFVTSTPAPSTMAVAPASRFAPLIVTARPLPPWRTSIGSADASVASGGSVSLRFASFANFSFTTTSTVDGPPAAPVNSRRYLPNPPAREIGALFSALPLAVKAAALPATSEPAGSSRRAVTGVPPDFALRVTVASAPLSPVKSNVAVPPSATAMPLAAAAFGSTTLKLAV